MSLPLKMISPTGRCLSLPLLTFTFPLAWVLSTAGLVLWGRQPLLPNGQHVPGARGSCWSLSHSEPAEADFLLHRVGSFLFCAFSFFTFTLGSCFRRLSIQKPWHYSGTPKVHMIFSDRERTLGDTIIVCSCLCLCMR